MVLVAFDEVVVDVEDGVEQRRPAEVAEVGVGAGPLVEVVVAARLDGVAREALPIGGVGLQTGVVRGQKRAVGQLAGVPIVVADDAPLIRGPDLVGGPVEGDHLRTEVVDAAVPALGAGQVHEGAVERLVPLELDVRSAPGHLAVVGVEVAVALPQRRIEVRILVAAVIRRIVVVGAEHVADGAVVAARVVPHVHPRAQAELVVELGVVVGQGAVPAVVVVRHPDEVGSLALPVGVDIQAVGAEFEELVTVPGRLQVERAVTQTGARCAGQRLAAPGAEAGVGRGRQGRLVAQRPDIAHRENGLEVVVLPGVVTAGPPVRRVHLAGLLIVVVIDLLVVHDELIEVPPTGHEVVLVGRIQDALQLHLTLGRGQFQSEVRIELVDLHLIGALAVALGRTERGEAQVVVAHGLAPLEIVGIGFGFEPGREALVGPVGADKVQEALLTVAEDARQAVPEVAVVAHLGQEGQAAVAGLVTPGQDVDGAAHRGDGQFAGPETPLDLGGAHDEVEAGPVAPVHPAVLHVVHGHPVHHDGEVGLVESADGHARIAVTTALLRRVDARCGVEDERQVTSGQLLLDLGGEDIGEGDRGLPVNGDVGRHDGFLEDKGLQPRIHGLGGARQRRGHRLRGIPDVGEGDVPLSRRQHDFIASVDVGGGEEVAGPDVGAHEGIAGEAIPDRSGDRAILGMCAQGTQHKGQEQREEGLHEIGVGAGQCLTAWRRSIRPSASWTSTR